MEVKGEIEGNQRLVARFGGQKVGAPWPFVLNEVGAFEERSLPLQFSLKVVPAQALQSTLIQHTSAMGRRCGSCGRWFDEGSSYSTECKDCRGRTTIVVTGGGGGPVLMSGRHGGVTVVQAPVVKRVREG